MSENQQVLNATLGVLTGEVDVAAVPLLTPRLLAVAKSLPGDRVTLDCSRLTFIDSSGVNMLLDVTARSGKRVQLVNVQRSCARVFEVLNLCGQFGVEACHDPSEH